ncbi:MAG: hypothetical protein KAV00_06860 [Phycisphaerae bacterium]|nr:hypothetical protein [Phycisphaerae bacterium]
MANTGHDWGAWAFAKDDGGTDWNADALADNGTETSNTAISLDKKSACEVGIALYEDNTGAIDGVVTVFVLGSGGGIADEETTIGSPWSFTITPVQNDTVYKRFSIDPGAYGDFKIAVKNEGGQELAVSVKYRTADIPVAA